MKRGTRPIRNALDPPMFQRAHMNIVHVPFKIAIITNEMLPIPSLPDAQFSGIAADFRQVFGSRPVPRDLALQQTPEGAETAVAGRQGPDAMQMIRQHDPGTDPEPVTLPDVPDGLAQHVDFPHQQIIAPGLQQIHREEPGTAGIRRLVGTWACRFPVGDSRRGFVMTKQYRTSDYAALLVRPITLR